MKYTLALLVTAMLTTSLVAHAELRPGNDKPKTAVKAATNNKNKTAKALDADDKNWVKQEQKEIDKSEKLSDKEAEKQMKASLENAAKQMSAQYFPSSPNGTKATNQANTTLGGYLGYTGGRGTGTSASGGGGVSGNASGSAGSSASGSAQ